VNDLAEAGPSQPGGGDQTLFLHAWQTWRKVLDHNYTFHREVYGLLRRVVLAEAPKPFRFLDIACGDAAASKTALLGTNVGHYYGIDVSRPALELARRELDSLGCPVTLLEQDFVAALAGWREPVDVAWIGQSLHHLLPKGKLDLMRSVRRVLDSRGLFLIWEPTSLEGEDRLEWVARFETGSRALWSALNEEEWNAIVSHVRASDYPETASRWQALGRDAGFGSARELYVAPTNLARVYCFRG